jgi:biopolymer transport protein TolR
MGGGAVPEGGGGGKRKRKALDAIINVVPAIDLLSCCISFLLFTAAWTQISRLQAQQFGTASEQSAEPAPKALTVTLQIGARGYVIQTSAGGKWEIPPLSRAADGRPSYDLKLLGERLKQLKTENPDQASVTVASEDDVLYQDLVRTIDACVGAGLPSVSVTAAG